MSKVLVTADYLYAIADAIREVNNSNDTVDVSSRLPSGTKIVVTKSNIDAIADAIRLKLDE